MTQKIKKRFIAGAKCPECQALDTLFVLEQYPVNLVSCVECTYKQRQVANDAPAEPKNQVIGMFKPDENS